MCTRLLILLVCLSWFLGCAQGQLDIERQKKIWEEIECNDGRVRVRAIQELGEIVEHSAPAQELLMERLFATDRGVEVDLYEVVRVLARGDATVVEKIISRYQGENRGDEKLKRLLYVFGRMGPKAKSAIPFLLKELEQNQENPAIEGCIRIVLANVGWDSNDNFDLIHTDIQNRTERGKAEIGMMSTGGPREWVSDDLAKALLAWFNQSFTENRDEPILAIILLSALGKTDVDTKNRLATFLKTECEKKACEDENCMWFGFSLAKSDPTKARAPLRPALRCVADAMPGDSFWAMNVLVGDILVGTDQRMMKELVRMLDSREPRVAKGVLWVLLAIGYDARQYAPDVLNILRANRDEEVREVAAQTLAFLADSCNIPELESVMKKEKSEFVRDEIVKAIGVIRLEPEQPEN